jgi:hypothetical protein
VSTLEPGEKFPGRSPALSLFLDGEHLPATIFAGLEIDMMRAAKLA